MATKKTPGSIANPKKKEIAKEIHRVLVTALGKWKAALGEKKMEKRIKKATRILTDGFKLAKDKKVPVKKAVVKKGPVKTSPAKKAVKKTAASKKAVAA
jgi:molybdenum cofactor biosynthesis enzyme MoaA